MAIKIFVISVGRSGTKSIAQFFGGEHEPDGERPSVEKTFKRMKGKKFYLETNHFWMWYLPKLRKAFPDAFLIHLIRDGRQVVKSFQKRGQYTGDKYKSTRWAKYRKPKIEGFDRMTTFEKSCWHWRYWNEQIEKFTRIRIRLEDIQHLLPLTNTGTFAPHWTDEERDTFERICGDTNKRYGYP